MSRNMLLKIKRGQRETESSAVNNVCCSCLRGLMGFWFPAPGWAAQLAVLWPQTHKHIQVKSLFKRLKRIHGAVMRGWPLTPTPDPTVKVTSM